MRRPSIIALILLASALRVFADQLEPLSADRFRAGIPGKGIVLLSVNWGRRYGCPGMANAQLLRLAFTQMPVTASSATLELKTPGKLLVNNTFLDVAYMLDPGKYAITEIKVLIAKTLNKVDEFSVGGLMEHDNPVGGTFQVQPNEAVYIGSFGMDCTEQGAVPWRFYLKDRASFDEYVARFKKRYPFAAALPVRYRLFDSTEFGFPFSLPDEQPSSSPPQGH
jgi:hypothetical protein